ncbi:MAG: hypothetical protein KatS3mg115_0041 [Candidatus Poribacteria bacterium]|nr:MAG: hypothetical protein KatS3mg115_0041 [Candidatus Poribacteria bacterium]
MSPRRLLQASLCGLLSLALSAGAVGTKRWTLESAEDFRDGEAESVGISDLGEMRLAPELDSVAELSEAFIWSIAPGPDGAFYVGTGNGGKIYRIPEGGEPELLVDTPELAILSLVLGPDGALYAGTAPDGLIYRISLASERPLPETIFQEGETYVWGLAFDADGALYAATGEEGKLYRLTRSETGAWSHTVLFDADDPHLRALALHQGKLYVGTDGSARVYRVDPAQPGKGFALYDTDQREVNLLLPAPNGDLIVGTVTGPLPRPQPQGMPNPRGDQSQVESFLYRVTPEGVARLLWHEENYPILTLTWLGEELLVGTGGEGKVYALDAEGHSREIADLSEAHVLVFQPTGAGILLGTSNSAKLYRLGANIAQEGKWESKPLDAGVISHWGAIRWEAELPEGTAVQVRTRSGNTDSPDSSWSDWSEPQSSLEGGKVSSPPARFLQVQVRLRSEVPTRTPVLRRLEVAYLPANLPPEVQEVRIAPPENEPPTTTRRQIRWQIQDPNEDPLRVDLYFRSEGESNWHRIEEKLRGNNYTWDTAALPDGRYRLRLVVTDLPGNPPDRAHRVEWVTEPFEIDHTPPRIAELRATREGNTVVVRFVAEDGFSDIDGAEYSLDTEEWTIVFPTDGLFDGLREVFEFEVPEVPEGTHSIAVRVRDAAGHRTTARARF